MSGNQGTRETQGFLRVLSFANDYERKRTIILQKPAPEKPIPMKQSPEPQTADSAEAPFESFISPQQSLTFSEAERVFSEAGIEFDRDRMISLGFFCNGLYTNLAFLISDQCTAGMKLAVYSDRSETGFIDRTEINGSILTHVQKAMDFLNRYNPLQSEINGLKRTDFRAYPENALKEALTDAVIHRDYSLNADTLVSRSGDRMTVTCYNGQIEGLGLYDILAGSSSFRNPRTATIFRKLGLIGSYSGVPHLFSDYENALLKPSLEHSTHVFKMTLPAYVPAVREQRSVDRIMKLATAHKIFSRADAEQVIGFSKTKTSSILSGMVDKGILKRIGNGRFVMYTLS